MRTMLPACLGRPPPCSEVTCAAMGTHGAWKETPHLQVAPELLLSRSATAQSGRSLARCGREVPLGHVLCNETAAGPSEHSGLVTL